MDYFLYVDNPMNTFLSMQVFRRVVEAGSFVQAAERMELSPAMASKHVRHLEDHLGVRLLNRTTRRLSLTEGGRAYYERCAQALNDLEDAEQAIRADRLTPRGTIRVNSLLSFGTRHLAPILSDYTGKYPQVTVELVVSDRVVDLVEDGFDLAIRGAVGELKPSSLVSRLIARAHLVACAAPSYLARHGTPKAPADLRNHNCLTFAHSLSLREWTFGDDAAQQRIAVSGNLVANSIDVLRAAAVAGGGIAMLGTDVAGDDLAEGRLVPLLPEFARPELGIHAVYPSRRHLSPKVRSFVDFLAARFAQRPFWSGAPKRSRAR